MHSSGVQVSKGEQSFAAPPRRRTAVLAVQVRQDLGREARTDFIRVRSKERDSHSAPLEAALAGRPRLTHCGVWLCALVLYDVASFLRCSQTWQRRFRPVYGFCPLALAPLNRAPRALAHPSPRRSAILECLSAPRALAGARKVPRMARRGHARIISVETHRLPFLGYLWRWVLVLILTLISQLCRPRRCNAPGQATRYHWRAAVSTTPIHSSSTTAPEARAAVRTR